MTEYVCVYDIDNANWLVWYKPGKCQALLKHMSSAIEVNAYMLMISTDFFHHLSRFQPHCLDVFLGRVAPRDGTWVGEHGARVRRDCQPCL